jgi:6-phosphofructokinase 1
MQQGGSPSPFDRNMGTKMSAKATEWMIKKMQEGMTEDENVFCDTPESAVLLGIVRRQYCFTPVQHLREYTDYK